MKKLAISIVLLSMGLFFSGLVWAECSTIQDGAIVSSTGDTVETGYDQWGYNYQAMMFNGKYCEYDRNSDGCSEDDSDLMMKWNTAWLSNIDCDGDNLLDRHLGSNTYIGSGAWLTNHQSGKVEVNGKLRKWTYFVKIVAVDENAVPNNGYWYTPDGVEIGEEIWGSFAIIQEVSNDPSSGEHGILYKAPAGPGLGNL